MLRQNLKFFLIFITIIALFILFKNGQIFDLGIIFRKSFSPEKFNTTLLSFPDNLEEEYKNLLVENNQLKELKQENNELRELLELKNKKEYNLAVVNILSRDPLNRNILIIDAGRDRGIENGQAVVVSNGIVVGKIIDAGIDSSKLRLLTDHFSKLAVKIGDDRNVSGILSGSLGLVMELSFIPQEQEIKKGDIVVTADIDPKIPSGLVVGQIENVEFEQEELFKEASVLPLINYEVLFTLAVITQS
ncbi:MAG: rod shape-determining protein MreC [Candidatus Komeilibacteria bacterium]|jgi:rod shape-determining protein MreC|nr:rod shape-determining protein MreC [Candidatus Komeilibacteria bacterium]MBT4447720.1 rod shape-determining protein MreC [Candidatus Komeilibacteria bacterium]